MLNQKLCPGLPWLSHDMRNHWSLSCFIPFIQFLYVKKKFSEPAQNSSKVVFQKCQVSASPACICSFPDRQITPCLFRHTGFVSKYLEKPNCHNLPPPQADHSSVEKGFGNQRPVPLEVPYLLPAERISPSSDLQDQTRIPKHLWTSLVYFTHNPNGETYRNGIYFCPKSLLIL